MLGCLIRKNKRISRIDIDNIECETTQYADDLTVILDGSNTSLLQTLNTLDHFERISGLKVNEDTTNVVYIGSLANQKQNPKITLKQLNWVPGGKFKALGVQFSTNVDEMGNLNYNSVLDSVLNMIQHWSKRNLTVLGRITVLMSLLIPKFNHLVFAIPNPCHVLTWF